MNKKKKKGWKWDEENERERGEERVRNETTKNSYTGMENNGSKFGSDVGGEAQSILREWMRRLSDDAMKRREQELIGYKGGK